METYKIEEGEIVGKTKEVIKLGRRFGKSEKEIILLLQEELHIDKDEAEDFLEKYDNRRNNFEKWHYPP